MFLYFYSIGFIMLSMGRKIQGFKVKVSALPHLPLNVPNDRRYEDAIVILALQIKRFQTL